MKFPVPALTVCLGLLCGLGPASSLRAAVLVRVSPEEYVHQVAETAGQVWVATDNGAYRVDGSLQNRVLTGVLVNAVAEVEGKVWLGSERGLFRVEGDEAEPILREKIALSPVTVIKSVDPVVWLGTERALYRIDGDTVRVILEGESIRTITVIQNEVDEVDEVDEVWVGTSGNAYRIVDSDSPARLFEQETNVAKIIEAGDGIWIVTNKRLGRYGPCYRVDDGRHQEVFADHEVISIAHVEGEAWFATTRGVFRLEGGSPRTIPVDGLKKPEEPVNTIAQVGDQIWIGTTRRAYRKDQDGFDPIAEHAQQHLNVKGISMAAGRLWVWGKTGLYRFDEDVEIRVQPSTVSLLGVELVFGRVVRIKKARYEHDGNDPYGDSIIAEFEAILESDEAEFQRALTEDSFTPVRRLERVVPYGFQDLHLIARDAYGNTPGPVHRSVLVIPEKPVWGILALLVWWLLSLVILGVAPWWEPCMRFVAFPLVRRWASLGAISVALCFAIVRRYLLRRYIRRLDSEFMDWPEDTSSLASARSEGLGNLLLRQQRVHQAISEFEGWTKKSLVFCRLVESRRLLVVGEPDAIRRCLRFLTWFATGGSNESLSKAVPVFLRLELHADDIENGAILKLADLGGITDYELASTLFRAGGFIFFLDGLGRLEAETRLTVERFIDSYKSRSFFVVGSDENVDSLDGFPPPINLCP